MKRDTAYYTALADAVGTDDAATAYARLSAETVTTPKTEARVTESDALSGLGMNAGVAMLDTLEANLPAPVIRVLQSIGINMADPEAQAQVEALRPAIGDAAANWLLAQANEVSPKYPRLTEKNIEDAIRMRADGRA